MNEKLTHKIVIPEQVKYCGIEKRRVLFSILTYFNIDFEMHTNIK